MQTPDSFRALALTALCVLALNPLHALADEATDEAVAVVERFNAAVTARDMEAAMDTLAEGSVQFQLRAIHPGMSDNPPLTADLRTTWKTVGAILFPISEAYVRKSTVTEAQAIGEVATVWANTTTHTLRKGKAEPMDLAFSEVYLLVRKADGWKIAGIADNRSPDSIQVSGQS